MKNDNTHFLRSYLIIGAILVFALGVRMWIYTPHVPFWDASVYILMGKYLFSSGSVGLIEPFRPPFWPFILGALWKMGLDPIVWGRILTLGFSLGNVYLTHLIGRKVYGIGAGLLAAFFLSVSPIFVFWGNHVYTGIPATFFGLLSVYMFLDKRYFASGFVGALGFFTRFLQALPLAVMACVHLIVSGNGERKRAFQFLIAIGVGAVPFLVFNHLVLGHALYPFIEGKAIYGQVSYSWIEGLVMCAKKLFGKESWFFLFIPFSLFLFLKHDIKNKEKWIIMLIAAVMFLWIGKLQSEILRFLLSALPYLYLLAADGAMRVYNLVKDKNIILRIVLCLSVLILGGRQLQQLSTMYFPKKALTGFFQYIRDNKESLQGNVWVSDPIMLVYSEIKPAELMYYPVFDTSKIEALNEKLLEADTIFFDATFLLCRPVDDAVCLAAKKQFIERIRAMYKAEMIEEDDKGRLIRGVFVRE